MTDKPTNPDPWAKAIELLKAQRKAPHARDQG